MSGISWPTAKMLFGVPRPLVNDPGEPVLFISLDVGGHDDEEVQWKEREARRIIKEHEKAGLPVGAVLSIDELTDVAPQLARFAEFPMTLDFLLDDPGGGLTWIGTYGPTKSWDEGASRCADLMLERGFPPILVTRPMKGGHYGVLRMITVFDKKDEEEVARVKQLQSDLLEICLDLGFVPYKAPGWAVEGMSERTDPGFKELVARVRGMLDPQGLMNPGRWPFEEADRLDPVLRRGRHRAGDLVLVHRRRRAVVGRGATRLAEEALHAAGREADEDPARRVRGVAEVVDRAARHVGEAARADRVHARRRCGSRTCRRGRRRTRPRACGCAAAARRRAR